MAKMKLNVVVEKLSCITIEERDGTYILFDMLRDKSFEINQVAYDICGEINGQKSLKSIAAVVAENYGIEVSQAEKDIWEFYSFLKRNRLIITKQSIYYYFLKVYSYLSFTK